MANTWIVTADSSRARIFTVENSRGPLCELDVLLHPEARLHEQDLTTDLPGRAFDSGGEGRHAMGQSVNPKEHEAMTFAKEVADYLDKGRVEGKYQKLFLVAGPRFLGFLRQNLSAPTGVMVAEEIGKNLVQHSPEDIRKHLPERL